MFPGRASGAAKCSYLGCQAVRSTDPGVGPIYQGYPLRFTIWLRNHSLRTVFSYRFSSIRRNSTFPGRAARDPKVAPKWIHKGSQRGPKVDPKWIQKGTKMGSPFGPKGDQKGTPFWTKRGPKGDPFLDQKGVPFWSPFWPKRGSHLGPLLGQKGVPFGPPFWPKKGAI